MNFTVRTHKFMNNSLLKRKQFIVDVIHPGISGISKKVLQEKLAKMFDVKDSGQVIVYGFRNSFGGGRSMGLGFIYDSLEARTAFEPKYRKLRIGLIKKENKSRKQIKEKKNREKKRRYLKRSSCKK